MGTPAYINFLFRCAAGTCAAIFATLAMLMWSPEQESSAVFCGALALLWLSAFALGKPLRQQQVVRYVTGTAAMLTLAIGCYFSLSNRSVVNLVAAGLVLSASSVLALLILAYRTSPDK